MSSFFSILNVSPVNRPYEWGFAAAQTASSVMWDLWNGSTAAARVAAFTVDAGGRTGSLSVTGSLNANGRLRVGDGTGDDPALTFGADQDTGFYRAGDDNIVAVVGGDPALTIYASRNVEIATDLEVDGNLSVDGTGDSSFDGNVEIAGTLQVDDVTYPGELTQGDIFYASADNTLARLAKGSDDQILRMNGNVPNWEAFPSDFTAGVSLDGNSLSRSGSGLKVSDTFFSGLRSVTSIADSDRIPFSDEDRTIKNRYITFADFKSALNISAAATWSSLSGRPSTFPPSAHTHSAAQITSGTLPVARGGTGATDAATARTNLGITSLGPTEASEAETTAGTIGNKYVSPRRLEGRLTAFFR